MCLTGVWMGRLSCGRNEYTGTFCPPCMAIMAFNPPTYLAQRGLDNWSHLQVILGGDVSGSGDGGAPDAARQPLNHQPCLFCSTTELPEKATPNTDTTAGAAEQAEVLFRRQR